MKTRTDYALALMLAIRRAEAEGFTSWAAALVADRRRELGKQL